MAWNYCSYRKHNLVLRACVPFGKDERLWIRPMNDDDYKFGTSALFVKRRLFVVVSLSNIHRFIAGKANYDLNREINILISEMKRTQLFHEALDRGLQALGQETAVRVNQSYHISHRRYPERIVLAKRNAGSVYEIAENRNQLSCFNPSYLLFSPYKLIGRKLQAYQKFKNKEKSTFHEEMNSVDRKMDFCLTTSASTFSCFNHLSIVQTF